MKVEVKCLKLKDHVLCPAMTPHFQTWLHRAEVGELRSELIVFYNLNDLGISVYIYTDFKHWNDGETF
jgi:hypothetical protein